MIVGIIIGSFFTAFTSKEFSIVKTDKRIVIKTVIGSMLMGIGAVWAKGCLIGNGLVATSQLATRAWLALLFIALGSGSARGLCTYVAPRVQEVNRGYKGLSRV